MISSNGNVLVNASGAEVSTFPLPQNIGNPDASGTPAEIWAQQQALPETYDDEAFSDTRLRMDVDSIKQFCARPLADVVAVANGNWSSNATWYNTNTLTQVKPAAGDRILIPQGITVTYDENSTTEYSQLRVDGVFEVDPGGDRRLRLDTYFVDHTGEERIGDELNPFPAQYDCLIEYPDNGDLDPTNDPFLMQRGFVCFGRSYIYGAPKLAFARSAFGVLQGATDLILEEAATGWEVGDEIMIAGTRYRQFFGSTWVSPEDETRIITGIDNTDPNAPVISWSGGLDHPHPACHRRADLTPHVANLTRNIKTYTMGSNPLPKHRAHQLFKNKEANAIHYVEARKMGRTDMGPDGQGGYNVPVDLMAFISGGGTVTADTNTTGRYPWHFHRNGASDPTSNPTVFEGLVAVDVPAWGYVHHDSHGIIRKCIAYDVQAVGFAGEGGASWGEVSDCLAAHQREPKDKISVASIKDGGHNLGTEGHGFWSNTRTLNFKRCVAIGFQTGIDWTSRPQFELNVYPGNTEHIRAYFGLVADPSTQIRKDFAVIEGFEDNEAYACNWAGGVAKSQPNQHASGLRSFLNGFTAWECAVGFHLQYTADYTLNNFQIYGFDPVARGQGGAAIGLQIYRRTASVLIADPQIEGFTNAIAYTKDSGFATDSNMKHEVLNPTIVDCTREYFIQTGPDPVEGNAEEITLPYSRYGTGFTDVDLRQTNEVSAPAPIIPGYDEDQCYWIGQGTNFAIAETFTLTDRLGLRTRYAGRLVGHTNPELLVEDQIAAAYESKKTADAGVLCLISQLQMELMMVQEGVWTTPAGDYVLLIPEVAIDRVDGEATYFYTPCALRMPEQDFNAINPTVRGVLGVHTTTADPGINVIPGGQDFTNFNPAGTPGLLS